MLKDNFDKILAVGLIAAMAGFWMVLSPANTAKESDAAPIAVGDAVNVLEAEQEETRRPRRERVSRYDRPGRPRPATLAEELAGGKLRGPDDLTPDNHEIIEHVDPKTGETFRIVRFK